jgi:diguanylate cyclase (GGDEF)-like protein
VGDPASVPADEERAILAELARLATEDLELRPMAQRVSDAIARRFDCEFVALVKIDREPARFVCEALTSSLPTLVHVGYGRELGSGIVGRVAAGGAPVALDDAPADPDYVETLPGARSELCVPIRHRGEIVAVLDLESPRPAAFRGLLPLFRELADAIAGAIASALWIEGTRRRARNLELLTELARRALEVEELEPRLDRMAGFLRARLELALAALLVSDDRGFVWRHRAIATRGDRTIARRVTWPVGAGIVGRAIRLGQPQLVLDVGSDPDYLEVESEATCEYVVPIRLRGRSFAALNVEASDRAQLDSENLALFRAAAEQAAGPIELGLVHRQLVLANRRLERLSREDPLTGLANRRVFDRTLELEWRRAERATQPLALAMVDLDRFKEYNDALGHPQGDRCIREVARLLRSRAQRAGDLVGRYGGEEFLLLLPATDAAPAARLVEGVRAELLQRALPHPGSPEGVVTLSAGVAARVPSPAESALQLVAAADAALVRAKREGRNRVVVGE